MKSRIARFGVLLIPVMALFATTASPAGAVIVGGGVVQGEARVGAGLAYYCASNGTVDVSKCPPQQLQNPKPGNIAFTFRAFLYGGIVKVAKEKCGPAGPVCSEVGVFTISGSGTVSGKCGLSGGTGTASIELTGPVVKNTKPGSVARVDFTFAGVGGTLILTGTFRDSPSSLLTGAVAAVPDATTGNSCLNKNQKTFILLGPIAVVDSNL